MACRRLAINCLSKEIDDLVRFIRHDFQGGNNPQASPTEMNSAELYFFPLDLLLLDFPHAPIAPAG